MTHRPDAAETPKKPAGRVSPSVVVNAVRHYPLAFAGLLAVAAAVAAGVWLFMPLPKHTAAVVYQVSAQAPRVISAADGQADAKAYREHQAATVKNRTVLNAALNALAKSDAPLLFQQPDQLAWLDKNLQVDFRQGSELMRVYLEGDNPDEMLAVVAAVAKAYQKELDKRETGALDRRLDDIEKSHEAIQKEIDAKQKRIERIAQSLDSTMNAELLAALERNLGEDLRAAQKDLADVRRELELAKADLPPDGKLPPATASAAQLDRAVGQEPAVVAAEQTVTKAKEALTALQGRVAEGGPGLSRARADVKSAEEARDKTRAGVRARVEAALQERMEGEAAAAADQKRAAYAVLVRKQKQAEAKVSEVLGRIKQHSEYRLELDKLKEEIGGKKKLIDQLDDERNRIRVEKRAPSRVIEYEPPYTQPGIEGFRRLRMTLVAAVGLFAVGFAGLVWWEHRSRRVNHSGEVADSLGLPLLGTLPPWAADQPGGHGELVEAIDSTRTVLLHGHTADRPLRTLVVTSALPGEGKTSLSGHLAVSLARAGYRTLLVDGDVRDPSAHKVFDLPPGPGLCEVLRGEAEANQATSDTKVPGLSVMPAGRWSLTARQALVGDRWGAVRRQLERQFDFVVLDTAPLLLTTDSLLLARGADGVVLSVLKGVSRIGSVAHTQERLTSLGARVLGVVVNGARPEYPGAYPYGRYAADPAGGADAVPLTPA